jgi:hypothetical protein
MNTNDIYTKIQWVELQLESATCSDAKCDYNYELANIKFVLKLIIVNYIFSRPYESWLFNKSI